jgi:hypothetical protein
MISHNWPLPRLQREMGRSEREDQPAALMFGRMRLLHTVDIN